MKEDCNKGSKEANASEQKHGQAYVRISKDGQLE